MPASDARMLAVGAAILFAVSAFLAFAGWLNGAFGLFAAGMALHALRASPAARGEPVPGGAADA